MFFFNLFGGFVWISRSQFLLMGVEKNIYQSFNGERLKDEEDLVFVFQVFLVSFGVRCVVVLTFI